MSARLLPPSPDFTLPDPANPLFESFATVDPGWIGRNGFMSIAYYVYAFDNLAPWVHRQVGLTREYRKATQTSTFVLEANLVVERPLRAGEPIRITSLLLDVDAKRTQIISAMYHRDEGWLAATYEIVVLFVDMQQRRSAAMPAWLLERFKTVLDMHAPLPRPAQAGRIVGLHRPAPF